MVMFRRTSILLSTLVALSGCQSFDPALFTREQARRFVAPETKNVGTPFAQLSDRTRSQQLGTLHLMDSVKGCESQNPTNLSQSVASINMSIRGAGRTNNPGVDTLFDVVAKQQEPGYSRAGMVGRLAQTRTLGTVEREKVIASDVTALVNAREKILSDRLGPVKSNRLVRAAAKAYLLASHSEVAEEIEKRSGGSNIDLDDIDSFKALADPTSTSGSEAACFDPEFWAILTKYYAAYFNGRFVNRFGQKLDQPSLKTDIENAVIKNFTFVFLEALGDYLLRTPIPVDSLAKPTKFYSGKSRPTAFLVHSEDLKEFLTPPIVFAKDHAAGSLTFKEAQAIVSLSSMSGSQAVAVSGGLWDFLGAIDVGFAIMGKINVGDQRTLSEMGKTAMEVIVRRSSEHLLYKGLSSEKFKEYQDLLDLLPGVDDDDLKDDARLQP